MKITVLYGSDGVILAGVFQSPSSGSSGNYENPEPVAFDDKKVGTFDVPDDPDTKQAAEAAAREEAGLTDAPGAYRRALLERVCLSHRVDVGAQRLVVKT